jgi:hypothetical protein
VLKRPVHSFLHSTPKVGDLQSVEALPGCIYEEVLGLYVEVNDAMTMDMGQSGEQLICQFLKVHENLGIKSVN